MGDFKKLDAWHRCQNLVASIYRLTSNFPSTERYRLSSQMRRAAVSVTANIAEGCGRQSDNELRRFLRITLGSLAELECELLLAAELQFVEPRKCHGMCTELRLVRRMLQRLHQALPKVPSKTQPTRYL
jgi:four helix bundle protein